MLRMDPVLRDFGNYFQLVLIGLLRLCAWEGEKVPDLVIAGEVQLKGS